MDVRVEEVESLVNIFEGCEIDIDDLRIIKRVLQAYKRYYNQLNDNSLSWREFESLAKKLRKEAEGAFGEEEALPWPIDKTFGNFVGSISVEREQDSLRWVESIEANILDINQMSVGEANRLHTKILNTPATLTDKHGVRLVTLVSRIEERLESLDLEWLIEKFKGLSKTTQKKFLEKMSMCKEVCKRS